MSSDNSPKKTNCRLEFKPEKACELLDLVIDSQRLRLIPVGDSFTEQIFQEFDSSVVQYMMPAVAQEIAETEEFVSSSRQKMSLGEELVCAITSKDSAEFLGCVGLHGRSDPKCPELGIWLKKSAHGHGYGFEAVELMVKWARENLSLQAFSYPVDRKNIPSCRIPERLGGTIVSEPGLVATRDPDKFLDEVVYHILA